MPLVLAPSFDEHSRAEIEMHIEQVRARRMAAAVVYYEGVNAKLEHEAEKVRKKMAGQYTMLGKELAQLDRIMEKVTKRLNDLISLQNELGLAIAMIPQEEN